MATTNQATQGETVAQAAPPQTNVARAEAGTSKQLRRLARKAARAKAPTEPAARAAKPTKPAAQVAVAVRPSWKPGLPKAANGQTGNNPCLCGCGTLVKRLFAQGHDARVHSWLVRLAEEGEESLAKAKNGPPGGKLPQTTQHALDAGILRMPSPKAPGVVVSRAKAS